MEIFKDLIAADVLGCYRTYSSTILTAESCQVCITATKANMHKSCATVFDNFISMQANKNLINIFLEVIVELSPHKGGPTRTAAKYL